MRLDAPWPQDPRLDPYRDSVWELRRAGRVEGYLTCRVLPVRAFPTPWSKSELVWYQAHWLDGRRERSQTDTGPGWDVVTDLEQGRFTHDDLRQLVFQARRVDGAEGDRLWAQYGRQS